MTEEKDFKKHLFLLGGMDLEMVTILNLLKQNGLKYINKDLAWGALLSAYKAYLNDVNTFVGIELTPDITPPVNYINIDHHNENSHRPASLQQTADLLGVRLTHYQQLICANDSGYIPAMVALGATPAQIRKIRKADRKAQGVTPQDEILATKAIREGILMINDLQIVYSSTSKFSAITDRLYPFKQLLIYTDHELNYYGKDAYKICKFIKNKIPSENLYSGGGPHGYFGLNRNRISGEKLFEVKEWIQESILTQKYHEIV